jgi:hypothetical protein
MPVSVAVKVKLSGRRKSNLEDPDMDGIIILNKNVCAGFS